MKKLWCGWFGHRWQPVWVNKGRERGATIEVCLRCRENGWRIT